MPEEPVDTHGGTGAAFGQRLVNRNPAEEPLHFVDFVILRPGGSIGPHAHKKSHEEFYFIVSGTGIMHLDGRDFPVSDLDLVRNLPGGTHGLINVGTENMKILVFQVSATEVDAV